MFESAPYEFKGPFTAGEIADYLKIELSSEYRDKLVKDVAPLYNAGDEHFSFFDNPKYLEQFKASKAGICVVNEKYKDHAPASMATLISKDPYRDYALVANMFYATKLPEEKIHPSAVIAEDAKLGKDVCVGANSVIESGVEIGDGTIISSNVNISAAKIGKNCIIYPGAKIGQDGFGFSMSAQGIIKVPQLGGVVIGDEVEIGANTTIDRGAGPNTVIGDYTKIDNLVQIGHNVEIGKSCVVVSQTGIAGSTKVGDYAVLGGQTGIAGHIKIGKGSQIAAGSGVVKNVPDGAKVGGYPAVNIRDWHKSTIAINKMIKNSGEKK